MEDGRADDRHWRDQAHQGDRHDLDRDAGLDAIDEVLAGVLAVPEVAGRGDREDRHRPGDEVGPIATEELHHLDHARDTVLSERARDDRLVRVGQGHVEPPGIGHLGLDIVVGREGRGEVRDIGQAVADADVLHEIRGVGQTSLPGPVVEDLEPRRAGHEMDPIATDIGVWLARPVVQPEGLRRVRDRLLNDLAREQDPLATMVQRQPVIQQALAHPLAANLHTDFGQHPLRLVDDPGGEVLIQDVQARAHQVSMGPPVWRSGGLAVWLIAASVPSRAPAMVQYGHPIAHRVPPDAPREVPCLETRRQSSVTRSCQCGTWVVKPRPCTLGSRATCASGSPWTRNTWRG